MTKYSKNLQEMWIIKYEENVNFKCKLCGLV